MPPFRNQCQQVWFRRAEDTEAMLLQKQSGSSWCFAWKIQEQPWYVCLCVYSIDLTATSKKSYQMAERDLILPLFSSAKHCVWTLVREEAAWLHSEGVCVTEHVALERRANYHFTLHGYRIKCPQKCLSAHNKEHLFFFFPAFFLFPFHLFSLLLLPVFQSFP